MSSIVLFIGHRYFAEHCGIAIVDGHTYVLASQCLALDWCRWTFFLIFCGDFCSKVALYGCSRACSGLPQSIYTYDICLLLDLLWCWVRDTAATLFHCTLVMDVSYSGKQAELVLQFDVYFGQFHLVYGSPCKLQVNLVAESLAVMLPHSNWNKSSCPKLWCKIWNVTHSLKMAL